MNGVIKSLHTEKGFGFIRGANGTEFFFHFSALKNAAMKDLGEGQEVEFEDAQGPKGPRAEDIYLSAGGQTKGR